MFTNFPSIPQYKGEWRAVQLEPIIGSGERITVAISAIGQSGEHKAIQAIRPELLETLYGVQSKNVSDMISLVIKSINLQSQNLNEWISPFEGIQLTSPQKTVSQDLNGILKQAIQLSASLSSLALTVEKDEESQASQVKKENQNWVKTIKDLVIARKPELASYFDAQYQVASNSPIKSKLSFASPNYVANIGILQPTRLSPSVQALKSKILDIEMFNHNAAPLFQTKNMKSELIMGVPDIENDITLTKKNISNIRNYTELLSEISDKQNISFHTVHSHQQAAAHIIQMF